MKFEYQLNLKDLIEGNLAMRRVDKYALTICIIIITLVIYLPPFLKGPISFQKIFLNIIAPSFFILATLFYGYCIQIFSYKKMLKLPEIKGGIIVETSTEGLTITTITSESKTRWDMYGYWKETSNLFVVYNQSNVLINIFPKRAFVEDEQIHKFRKLLFANLSTKPQNRQISS
jgi:YcxB-like protein